MAAYFAVAWRAVVINIVARRRVLRRHQRHVALAALDGGARVAGMVPPALSPVVVLVLQLHPAHVVDFLVYELLVAGGAVLGRLEKALAQIRQVLARVGANQEIAEETVGAR